MKSYCVISLIVDVRILKFFICLRNFFVLKVCVNGVEVVDMFFISECFFLLKFVNDLKFNICY